MNEFVIFSPFIYFGVTLLVGLAHLIVNGPCSKVDNFSGFRALGLWNFVSVLFYLVEIPLLVYYCLKGGLGSINLLLGGSVFVFLFLSLVFWHALFRAYHRQHKALKEGVHSFFFREEGEDREDGKKEILGTIMTQNYPCFMKVPVYMSQKDLQEDKRVEVVFIPWVGWIKVRHCRFG